MCSLDKIIIKWTAIVWVCLFVCYYAICTIYYYSNHTEEEYQALQDQYEEAPGTYCANFVKYNYQLLTFQKVEVSE